MLIIGIAGGTGSGKTTVVRKIFDSLPKDEVVLLPQDSYYKDSSNVPVEKRQFINFDHPDSFEWDLLSKHIQLLKKGESIEQPTYSYLTCTRQPETIHIEPRDVIIVEGILALSDKKLRSACTVASVPTSVHQPHCRLSSSLHGVPIVVITGVPLASASATTIPKFSLCVGNIKRSA